MPINSGEHASEEEKIPKRENILDLKNDYEILGVDEKTASLPEIKKAYLELAKKYHPDKHVSLPIEFQELAAEIFKKIGGAYERLSKKHRFQVYSNPEPREPQNPDKETNPENKAFNLCKAHIIRAAIADNIDTAIMIIRAYNKSINFDLSKVVIPLESFKATFTKNGQKIEFKIIRYNSGISTEPFMENSPKDKERSELYIKRSKDFQDLYIHIKMLVKLNGPIQGSKESYSAEKIISLIDEVRETPSLVKMITNTFGIRDKVIELLKAEKK